MTWAERADNDLEERRDELNTQMLGTHDQLERFNSWDGIRTILEEEQKKAFLDVMNAEGDQILLARERAKFINKLLQRPRDLQAELDRLHAERDALEE